jgi:putative membrane protein
MLPRPAIETIGLEGIMNHRLAITLSAAVLALGAGCKRQGEETGTTKTTSATETPATTATATATAPIASEDKEFITKAAEGGMLEVTLGAEAARKASMPDVKTLGDRMVTDHSKVNDELKQLAAKKGVTLPTEMDKEHKSDADKLTKLSGTKFEREYADFMVDDHEKDVKEFRKASKDAKDPELRAWAAKTLPVLEQHLDLAKAVKAKTKH